MEFSTDAVAGDNPDAQMGGRESETTPAFWRHDKLKCATVRFEKSANSTKEKSSRCDLRLHSRRRSCKDIRGIPAQVPITITYTAGNF